MNDKERVKQRLLKDNDPNKVGTWKILGEDPNCDWGGHHHQPELEVVFGTYRNVVDYAVNLKSFFTWGGGGNIAEIKHDNIKNVDNFIDDEIKRLRLKQKELQAEMSETNRLIETLTKESYKS